MKNKFNNVKTWTKEHKDDIIGVGVLAGLASIYVAAIAVANKQANVQREALNTTNVHEYYPVFVKTSEDGNLMIAVGEED